MEANNQIKNNHLFNQLGKTGIMVSPFGFGGYRIDVNIDRHKEALSYALKNGINLIDTSSNYSDGGSESLIGEVIKNSSIDRNDLVIVTKAGYIQGSNLKEALQLEEDKKGFEEITKCSPDLWHCINPGFLKNQLDNSLGRLKLNYVDIFLLHNPEYFLTYSSIKDQAERENEYYRRIENAFKYLEKETSEGRIKYYGVSSNSFGAASSKNNFTSLLRLIEIAESISKDNRFGVIQFPLNLIEKDAAVNKNQEENSISVIDLAKKANIGILINRPLNAIEQNKVERLADFDPVEDRTKLEIDELIENIKQQESELILNYVNDEVKSPGDRRALVECLSLSKLIKENYQKFDSPNYFREVKSYYLIPRAQYVINELAGIHEHDKKIVDALRRYAVATNILFDSIESELARNKNELNKKLHTKLNEYLPAELHDISLQQKALLMLKSIDGVSSVLLGMREKKYVDDVLAVQNMQQQISAGRFWTETSD